MMITKPTKKSMYLEGFRRRFCDEVVASWADWMKAHRDDTSEYATKVRVAVGEMAGITPGIIYGCGSMEYAKISGYAMALAEYHGRLGVVYYWKEGDPVLMGHIHLSVDSSHPRKDVKEATLFLPWQFIDQQHPDTPKPDSPAKGKGTRYSG